MRYLLLILLTSHICSASERRLTATLNPDCPIYICDVERNDISVVHIVATGLDDVIHYVWDFTGTPSVLLAVTPIGTSLVINWETFINGTSDSIHFYPNNPSYTFCVMINKIMEFNDVTDSGIYNNDTEFNILHTKYFSWTRKDFIDEDDMIELFVSSNLYSKDNRLRSGLFSFVFKSFPMRGHGPVLPHLLHSANSSQVDFVLENVKTDSKFSNSRYAVELIMVSQERKDDLITIDTKKSLDDEHTPGIFEIVELQTAISRKISAGGFIQFRPVSYTNPTRSVTDSTDMHHSEVANVDKPQILLYNSLAYAYYGKKLDRYLVQGVNVTFGGVGDGFYKKTNYTTWTFLIGYGAPPEEQFSLLVILVISIGLGLPFLLMIIGALYFCGRKLIVYRNTSSSAVYR